MIDAEQLLGKVLAGAMQGTGGKKRKKRKYRQSDNLVGGLLGGLSSGKGLITAIGLGVGAYEILRQKSAAGSPAGAHSMPGRVPSVGATPADVTAPPPPGGAMPPPLPGRQPHNPTVVAPPVPGTTTEAAPEAADPAVQHLAVRLIQVMVAAAHADGRLDSEEEKRILEKLQEQGLSQEEKQFLLGELHRPRTIAELTDGVREPMVAQTMYSLATSTIVIDTPEERRWLDQLAAALSISENLKRFIEEDL